MLGSCFTHYKDIENTKILVFLIYIYSHIYMLIKYLQDRSRPKKKGREGWRLRKKRRREKERKEEKKGWLDIN